MLVRYIRNKYNAPVGCIVATDENHIGWSLCNLSHGDIFSKEIAKEIAISRAYLQRSLKLPASLVDSYTRMVDRAKRYFKGVCI